MNLAILFDKPCYQYQLPILNSTPFELYCNRSWISHWKEEEVLISIGISIGTHVCIVIVARLVFKWANQITSSLRDIFTRVRGALWITAVPSGSLIYPGWCEWFADYSNDRPRWSKWRDYSKYLVKVNGRALMSIILLYKQILK